MNEAGVQEVRGDGLQTARNRIVKTEGCCWRWQMTGGRRQVAGGSKTHRYAPCRPTVNAALVHRQFAHLLGEICAPWRCGADGRNGRVVPYLRRPGARSRSPISSERTGPDPSDHTARPAVMHGGRPQKSAEAIAVFQCFTRMAEHEGPNLRSRA